MEYPGIAHFISQADWLGRLVLTILLVMSLASWTVILVKLFQFRAARRGRRRFVGQYLQLAGPAHLERHLADLASVDALARIAGIAFAVLGRWSRRSDRSLMEDWGRDDMMKSALSLAVSREQNALESGLAALAAVGTTAPFVGLLGTVWGIYHALIAIGVSGQGTLDKVAGPVGEALVMTALGLAVAIPAVLAYNGFVRAARHAAGELDAFAHELMVFLSTGIHATVALAKPAPIAGMSPLAGEPA